MGSDIFNALLLNFNGFPSLPIFIGDFLLSQLKQYFFIPATLCMVFLVYHYITKAVGGGHQFAPIAIRAVTALSIIWGILSFSMPMSNYITDVLKTNPEIATKNANGQIDVKTLDMNSVEMQVFSEMEHFYIVQLMSAFVTYSDNIANNLTRKILYGTTDVTQINSEATLVGYFPAILFNLKDAREAFSKEQAEKFLQNNELSSYFGSAKGNANTALTDVYNAMQLDMCKKLIGINWFDTTNSFFIPNRIPVFKSDNKLYAPSEYCPAFVKKIPAEQLNELGKEWSADIQEIKLPDGADSYSIQTIAKLNYFLAMGKDNKAPETISIIPNGTNSGEWASDIKTLNDLTYKLLTLHDNKKGGGVDMKDPFFNTNKDAMVAYSSLVLDAQDAGGNNMPTLEQVNKASEVYANLFKNDPTAEDDILISTYQNLIAILNAQRNKTSAILGLAKKSDSSILKGIKGDDPLAIAESMITLGSNYLEEIKKEVQNVSTQDDSKFGIESLRGSSAEVITKEAVTQAYKTVLVSAALEDYYYAARSILTREGKNPELLGAKPNAIIGTKDGQDGKRSNRLAELKAQYGIDNSGFFVEKIEEYIKYHTGKDYKTDIKDTMPAAYIKADDLSDSVVFRLMEDEIGNRMTLRKMAINLVINMTQQWADVSSGLDMGDPFLAALYKYTKSLREQSAIHQYSAIQKLGGEGDYGMSKIRNIQQMFGAFNEMRPEGTFPLKLPDRPIAWTDLGVFYSIFKNVFDGAIREAFIMGEIGKRNDNVIMQLSTMSNNLTRENQTRVAVFAGALAGGLTWLIEEGGKTPDRLKQIFSGGLANGINGILKANAGAAVDLAKNTGTMLFMIAKWLFVINVLLPSGIWMLALLGYFTEVSMYLSIAPIMLMLMIFQVYHGIVTKYINILIMLFLYPSVLVSLYFIVLFIDMMLPMLIYSFFPWFNNSNALGAAIQTTFGQGGATEAITTALTMSGGAGSVGDFLGLLGQIIATTLLSSYLVVMILKAQSILTSMLQGGGADMIGQNGFTSEANTRLQRMSASGPTGSMIM